MLKALNKLTGLGMPETQYIVQDIKHYGIGMYSL